MYSDSSMHVAPGNFQVLANIVSSVLKCLAKLGNRDQTDLNRSFYSFTLLVNLLIAVNASVDAALYLALGNMYLSQYPTWLLVNLFFTALQGILMSRMIRHIDRASLAPCI